MPLQERFGARPIWACLVACPVHEITSFVVDSSRSRKSVFQLFKSHTSFRDIPELKAQVTSLCKRQFLPVLRRGPFGRTVPVQKALLFPALTSILFQAGLAFNEW